MEKIDRCLCHYGEENPQDFFRCKGEVLVDKKPYLCVKCLMDPACVEWNANHSVWPDPNAHRNGGFQVSCEGDLRKFIGIDKDGEPIEQEGPFTPKKAIFYGHLECVKKIKRYRDRCGDQGFPFLDEEAS